MMSMLGQNTNLKSVTNYEDLLNHMMDRYDRTHQDALITLDALNEGVGQAFTSRIHRLRLTDAVFYISRNATFNGTLVARLYEVTGVVGTTAVPAGAALATSDNITQADIAVALGLVNFHFTTPYTLEPEHDYAIVIWVTVWTAGQVNVGIDTSTSTHLGNEVEDITGAWVPQAAEDCIFYLFSFSDVMAGGEINLTRYLGVACGPANPIDVSIAAIIPGVVFDVSDRAARLLGIVYGNLAQLQQIANLGADGLTPTNLQTVANFMHVYDSVAADWNRLREGAAIGQALVDPADRWARQLGLIDLSRVLGAALTPANPVVTGVFDAAGNRMPSMDVAARPGFVDVIDRAARLLGVVYGSAAAQLLQGTPAETFANPANALATMNFPMIWDPVAGDWNRWIQSTTQGIPQVQGTGVNTNPERWLQDYHWGPVAEIPIVAAGAGGELAVGAAVGAGVTRRIREVTIRHAGTNNTVVTIWDATGVNIILSIDVPAQSTRTWSSQDGRAIAATLQPVIQTSDVTGGSTFVTVSGVEQ